MGVSKPKTAPVVQNAPGSVAAATIDSSTADARDIMRERLQNARGKASTDKTKGGATQANAALEQLKKHLLGD